MTIDKSLSNSRTYLGGELGKLLRISFSGCQEGGDHSATSSGKVVAMGSTDFAQDTVSAQ